MVRPPLSNPIPNNIMMRDMPLGAESRCIVHGPAGVVAGRVAVMTG